MLFKECLKGIYLIFQILLNGKVVLKKGYKMKCTICKNGNSYEGFATVTLERDGATIVFKDVPALICENCGEKYIDGKTTASLMKSSDEIIKSGVEVDIRKYQVAA